MSRQRGVVGAVLANLLWGLSPLYYVQLGAVSPVVLLCFQVLLTFAVLAAVQGGLSSTGLSAIRHSARTALLIGLNWAAYVVAVMKGEALQASYAYFIAPILTVLLGSIVFREAMPLRQKFSVAVTIFAVTLDVVFSGEVPYLGLLIAVPFAVYVIEHKRIGSSNPVSALKTETFLMAPLALIALVFVFPGIQTPGIDIKALPVLALIGVVNALPLLLFIRSAPALSASQLGASQFIAPVTSAVLSYCAFGAQFGAAKCTVLVLLAIGMAGAVLPARKSI